MYAKHINYGGLEALLPAKLEFYTFTPFEIISVQFEMKHEDLNNLAPNPVQQQLHLLYLLLWPCLRVHSGIVCIGF